MLWRGEDTRFSVIPFNSKLDQMIFVRKNIFYQWPLMLLLLASLCCLVTLLPGLLLSALGPLFSLLFPLEAVRSSSCKDIGSPFPPPLSSCIFGLGLALYSPRWKIGPPPFSKVSFGLLISCSHFSTTNLFPPRASVTFPTLFSSVLIPNTFSLKPFFTSVFSPGCMGARLFSISSSTF